ncbi:purine-binding chemotaxis protein CheW [candidate division WOR-3 bacterium]|nr:purine-binding chemotaxis protein CheW [candidate division WOR-3 bacterium]
MKRNKNNDIEKINELLVETEETQDKNEFKYISFSIDKEKYGIEVERILKIVQKQEITKIPDLPPFVMGIMQMQNRVVPIVSLTDRFGLEGNGTEGSVIIVSIQGQEIGLMVDKIEGIKGINRENIVDVPKIFIKRGISYFAGIGILEDSNIVTFLDTDKILKEEEIKQIENIKQENN